MATEPKLLSEFLQFMEDLPFAGIGTAVASGGLNIAVDVATVQQILAAAVKDFYDPAAAGTSVATAPATAAAISAAAS